MAGVGDFTAWWDNERSALRKKLARAVEAARHDPKGAFEEFAKGTRDYGAGRLEGLARAEIPGASLLPRGVVKEALSPSPDSWEQGTDAREVGELAGVPEPGGGQMQEAAKREVLRRVPTKLKSAAWQEYLKQGSVTDVLDKYGVHVVGREVYDEINPSKQLKVREWRPGETETTFGDLVEYPEFVKEYNKRSGGQDLNTIPVKRVSGYQGGINYKYDIATLGQNPLRTGAMTVGDHDMDRIVEHELGHSLDALQSGKAAGGNPRTFVDQFIKDSGLNPRGLTAKQIYDRSLLTDPVDRLYAQALYDKAHTEYLRRPGEVRSRLSESRLRAVLTDEERLQYPVAARDVSVPGAARYLWESPEGVSFQNRTNADLILRRLQDWDDGPQFAQAVRTEGLDDLVKSARPEKLEDILKELLASP